MNYNLFKYWFFSLVGADQISISPKSTTIESKDLRHTREENCSLINYIYQLFLKDLLNYNFSNLFNQKTSFIQQPKH